MEIGAGVDAGVAAVLVSESPLAVTPSNDGPHHRNPVGRGRGLGAGVATKPATTLLSVAFWE